MMRLLLFIKHRLHFLWRLVEWGNGLFFRILFQRSLRYSLETHCQRHSSAQMTFRLLNRNDAPGLAAFFQAQPAESYQYFKPHEFDEASLRKLAGMNAFFMLGGYGEDGALQCYFMVRAFLNKQVFVGFLVGCSQRGKGIARKMGEIMFPSCWENGFRVFATVSKQNKQALAAYRKINDFTVLKELPDDYIYIEYSQKGMKE